MQRTNWKIPLISKFHITYRNKGHMTLFSSRQSYINKWKSHSKTSPINARTGEHITKARHIATLIRITEGYNAISKEPMMINLKM